MARLGKKPLFQYISSGNHINYAAWDNEAKNAIREIGVRNMFIRNRLTEVMTAFEHEGITAVVLKGAHLLQKIYPFGIRPIEDIDLLVRKEDLYSIDAIIRDMGYECDLSMGWTHEKFSNKLTYINDSLPAIPIDIHFCLGPYPYLGRIATDVLFTNIESIESENGRITVLRPELLLIHLCLHLFQHHFDDWQVSCCDIVAVIRHDCARIDWDRFKQLVVAHRLGFPVAYSLRKAKELADIQIPDSIETAIQRNMFRERIIFLISRKQSAKSDRHFLQFFTTPGIAVKFRGMAKIIYPGRPFLRQFYHGSYIKYASHVIKTAVKLSSAVFMRRSG